ncbi:hypothetical protein [Dietzia cercidiphylli]|uniref:Uncharacterized protein n=1 Tax=Dietzia cercidiphylli TaxID=498199 RepID=A0ABN2JDC9_9ACTN|nr:hypothetical protein [Dietzia cercidiphylli]MBB1046437.1 hypothetical protein [Dietzia cercidiphylli]
MTTFVVNDPAVCDQVAELLGPFRSSKPGRPATNDRVRDREALLAAERRIADLEQDISQTQYLLAQSTAKLAAEREAHDETTAKLVAAESDLAQTSRELEGGRAELERVREELTENRRELTKLRTQPAPATVKPLHGNSTRAKDRDAFTELARRMDEQARTQPKPRADVLRIAAGAVRDEVEKVYGTTGKKAS